MMLKSESVKKYLADAKAARAALLNDKERFWEANKKNFEKNVTELASLFKYPKKWRVNVIAAGFLPLGRDDQLSFSDMIGATEKQGFDMVVFFNRANMGFLSKAAMLPIIVHEMKHVDQAIEDPKRYAMQAVDDELYASYEVDAEAEIKKYPDEFRKQAVFEKMVYAYYNKGWKGAKEEAHYLHELSKNYYGDGYEEEMNEEEYSFFKEAEKRKDFEYFVREMLKSF